MSPAPKPLAPIAVAFVLLASGCVALGRIGEAVFLLWSGAVCSWPSTPFGTFGNDGRQHQPDCVSWPNVYRA
jgi:hypothetical protein